MMLARHAEDLFWIGRNLERAENTVRMLDVTYHAVLEAQSSRPSDELWAELLEALFLEDEIDAGRGPAIGPLLVADTGQPSSVVSLLGRARDNARGTREWLSSEFWEAINGLLLDLAASDLPRHVAHRPYDAFRTVKAGCHMLTGVAEAMMPRGEGYVFLELGRMIERGSMTARVLSVWHRQLGGFTGSAAFLEWVTLLKTLAAYEAYLRVHRAAMVPDRVLEFLLRSPTLPRSILFTLTRAEHHLSRLPGGEVGHPTRRAAGRIRSSVEFTESTGLDHHRLQEFLEDLEEGILDLGRTMEGDYFQVTASDATLHSYEAF